MTAKGLPLFVFTIALVLLRFHLTAARDCYDALDIVQVQDVTSSFSPFLPSLTARVGSVITKLAAKVPDAYFGVVSFGDKGISGYNKDTKNTVTLGDRTDYCLRVDSRLQRPDSTQMTRLFQRYQSNRPAGGGDPPAGVFEGLYRAFTASNLGWRQEPLGGKIIRRTVVVVTGTTSHFHGDVLNLIGNRLPPFDITPYTIRGNGNNENYGCDKVEYPSLQQISGLLEELEDTYVKILVAPGGTRDSQGRFQPYQSVAGLGSEYQREDGLKRWYEKQLDDAGLFQVQVIQLDPEMWSYAKIIDDITREACSRRGG